MSSEPHTGHRKSITDQEEERGLRVLCRAMVRVGVLCRFAWEWPSSVHPPDILGSVLMAGSMSVLNLFCIFLIRDLEGLTKGGPSMVRPKFYMLGIEVIDLTTS